jgi:hypothetical protein
MVDYSLAAQVRAPQFADPMQMYAQMQQLQTNRLAAQRLQQNIASENELRNLFRGGQFNLESPELAARIGAVDPDMAFKVLQAQRQAKLTQRQTDVAERQAEEGVLRIAKANAELISAQGDTFRQALGRVDLFPEDQRAGVYKQLHDSLPPGIRRLYPAQYSPDVVRRGMMTTDQLIAGAKETQPKYQALPGDVPGEYVPGQGVRVLPVLPTPGGGIPVGRGAVPPEQAGVPSYPVPAARQAAMAAAGQRFAPELMGAGAAPAPAPTSPFGAPASNAMAQPTTGFDLAQRAREQAIQQEREKELVRTRVRSEVAREEGLPKAQSGFVSATEALDRQLRSIDDLLSRPGALSLTVGPLVGRSFSPTGLLPDVQGAQALIDQIKSTAGLTALTDLKQAGGTLGAVSNEEGRRLEASVAALNQLQGTDDFRKQLQILRSDVRRARQRLGEAFEREYKIAPPETGKSSAAVQRMSDTSVMAGGATYTFPTKEAADAFLKKAGQ